MANQAFDAVMQDLQNHMKNANLNLGNLSTIARNGDEKLVEKFLSETVFVQPSVGERRELADNKKVVLQSQLYVGININAKNPRTLWTPLHAATFQEHGPVRLSIYCVHILHPRSLDSNRLPTYFLRSLLFLEPHHFQLLVTVGPLMALNWCHGQLQSSGDGVRIIAKVIMYLLEKGADPNSSDYEGRTPVDFASASDKTWGHFAALKCQRTPISKLIQTGIIKKGSLDGKNSPKNSPHLARRGIEMADYSQPNEQTHFDDKYSNAALCGDVLANDEENTRQNTQPQFSIYK
ncbi:hypothetical protein LSH36_568g03039 [Paralvinella palmiformis]|uniref:Uncharacterized protein n=1 Tax=Paralvinella palmiformis TaxID=53620 RepID=A0AAD9MX98_9ANNE|nr:hypothetical protein LSH36_568g03039 [Paralvinella palmiformis]